MPPTTPASESPPRTVLLVEDDGPTRSRLARAIADSPALALAAACGSCAEARSVLEALAPDVLLTDLGLPDGTGIDLIRLARQRHPDTQAMVVTVLGDEATVLEAIEAGATGYLLKDGTARDIGAAIQELLAGGSPISAPIARLLLKRLAPAGPPPPAPDEPAGGRERARQTLTEREVEVLELVAKGFSFPEIARLLAISPHTVTAHVRHIYEKLEVRSRGEAVFEAVQQGLIKIGR